jgi:hypothetical protein
VHVGLGRLWLDTWSVRGEVRLILGNEEVLGSILVGGRCIGGGHEVVDKRRRAVVNLKIKNCFKFYIKNDTKK